MKDFLTVLFRRKRHAAWFFVFMVGVPVGLSYVLPRKYEAKATLLLTTGREKKPFVPNEKDSRMSFMQVSMEDVGSEVELLLSRPVLERVVDSNHLEKGCSPDPSQRREYLTCAAGRALRSFLVAVGLKTDVPAREAAIDRLHDQLQVEFLKRTNIIEVRWRGSSPRLARDVVNSLVEAYLAHHIRVFTNAYALDAIQSEVDAGRVKLNDAQARLSAYGARHSISNMDRQRAEILERLSEAEGKVNILEGMGQKEMPTAELGNLAGDPAFLELSKRLTDAELRKIDLSFKYKADSWQVVSVNQEIDQIRSLIRERLQGNLARWRELEETYRGELRRLDQAKLETDKMQREIDDFADRDRLSREKLHEVLISEEMDKAAIGSVKVVQYADISSDPAFPRRPLILVVSLFLGLVGSVTQAFAVDRMKGTVTSVSDVETAAGGPALASIPEYPRREAADRLRLLGGLRRDLIPVEKILSKNGSAPARVLLVTSPSSGAGTTLVAQGVARAASSSSGASVLLISLRRKKAKDGDAGPGRDPADALRLLASREALPKADARETYDHLVVDLGREDLQGEGSSAESLLTAARQRAVFVLVDVGGERGDTLYLKFAPLVDAVLFVAAYDRTGRFPLARMADLVRRHGGRVAGCVLNRRRDVIPRFLYRRLSQ